MKEEGREGEGGASSQTINLNILRRMEWAKRSCTIPYTLHTALRHRHSYIRMFGSTSPHHSWRHEIVIAKLRFTKIKVCQTILLAWKIVVCALCVVSARMYMFVLFCSKCSSYLPPPLPLPPFPHVTSRRVLFLLCFFPWKKFPFKISTLFASLIHFFFFLFKFCMEGMKTTMKTFNAIDIWTLFFRFGEYFLLWFIEMIGNWN